MVSAWRKFSPALALALTFALAGCGGSSSSGGAGATQPAPANTASAVAVPGPLGTYSGVATTHKAPDFVALPGAKAAFGTLGKALYQVEMPEKWNGDLVMWAHGFAGFGTELSVNPPPQALRREMIEQGYAWAASSYSENGYTPGIGADDTLALKQFFARQYGAPRRTYIVGESMGGNVVALSLENFPDQYDGGLSFCGAVAGEEQIDFLTSWAALAEFTSGVTIPFGQGSQKVTPVVLQELPKALGSPEAPTPKGIQFASLIKHLTGGPRPFFAEGLKAQYLLNFSLILLDPNRLSLPARAATNERVVYHIDPGLGLTDDQVNAGVRRFAVDPESRNARNHPDAVPTTGKITKPLLTLHGTGDLFVPISQEQSYRQKVDSAGKGDLLVQRAIRAPGHCVFSAEEYTTAFSDLVSWVKDGRKPKGDDLLGDLTDIGRQFTNPLRNGDPGAR